MEKIIVNFKLEDGIIYKEEVEVNKTIGKMLTEFSVKKNLKLEDYCFVIGALCLNTKFQTKIKNVRKIIPDCIINVICIEKIAGGGGIKTVDISKDITKEYKPSSGGPSYQTGCNGLCIQSTCKNEECEAYNERIYIRIGYVSNWNLLDHQEDQVICPSCKEMVNAENYWFKDCYYQINFIKTIDGRPKKGSIDGEASSDKYKTFDEKESGKAIFSKLVFNVSKL